jgi:hypothetical protein
MDKGFGTGVGVLVGVAVGVWVDVIVGAGVDVEAGLGVAVLSATGIGCGKGLLQAASTPVRISVNSIILIVRIFKPPHNRTTLVVTGQCCWM